MKNFVLLAGALALTACNPIKGQLNVTQAFHAHSDQNPANCTPDDPRPDCSGPVQPADFAIAPGTYEASFDLSSRSSAVFSIKLDRWNTRNVTLQIPSNNHLPNYSGPISLSHDESGQPFDLRGNVTTQESDGPQQSGWQSCTRTEYQQQCGQQGCYTVPVQVPGQQFVRYHLHYTDTKLDVQIIPAGKSAAAATFAGERNVGEQVAEYVGYCQ
jgi:hypothetical protein